MLGAAILAAPASSLSPRYQSWLEDVTILITDAEREVFLGLSEDYQRGHFIRRFWKIRDPFPQTAVNEFREVWEGRARLARDLFGGIDNEATRMVLLLGEPERRERLTCSQVLEPLDVWIYPEGTDRIADHFTLVFRGTRVQGRVANYRLWQPDLGVRQLLSIGAASRAGRDGRTNRDGLGTATGGGTVGGGVAGGDAALTRLIFDECIRGDDIVSALATALDVRKIEKIILPKPPSDEWVRAFKARSTDAAETAEPLAGELTISFPGRHQSRTVVQGLVAVPREAAAASSEGNRFYNLLLDGEVLRRGELFDHFRYRFDYPVEQAGETLPLILQRYLRPGNYELIVKVEDLHSGRVFRQARDLKVPIYDVEREASQAAERLAATSQADADRADASRADADRDVFTPKFSIDIPQRLDEANQSISTGDHTIKIVGVPDRLQVGKLRVKARVRGEGVARVAFELNGELQMRKTRPPYSVEIDLGDKPRIHRIRALALAADGTRLALDEVEVNAGPQRFSIRLLEPQRGQRYADSVRVHAVVEIPEHDQLDRVELFLNETRLATLYQPPFEHPLLVTGAEDFSYVRAVAYLVDGGSTEETVIINAPGVEYLHSTQVNFKELYTTMLTKKGDFVEDVEEVEITVLEDDIEQKIQRFEKVRDLPIIAGLMIDTSTSIAPVLRDVRRAAHRFLETVLTPRDRAAIMTFNDTPQLVVKFTSDTEVLAGGLSGLVAEGETALYDSVIFALHYLSGGSGKRAIVLLTDGEDSSSVYTFDDAIDFARHTGVAVYIIGLGLPLDPKGRAHVRQLASETGGESFFIERVDQLGKVYESIQRELRSQYLIGYQSSQSEKPVDQIRRVEVRIDRKGVEAKTIRGYYP